MRATTHPKAFKLKNWPQYTELTEAERLMIR